MKAIDSLVTVGIASKDRPEVLDQTLRKVHAFGLAACPLLLFDDGSSPHLNPPAVALFKRARIIRVARSVGHPCGRNVIADEASTPFLLQLDDDSYPVEGDMQALLGFASQTARWLAIAMPFDEPTRERWSVGVPADRAVPVRSFVGCSVLLNVESFRRLGGHAAWIGKSVEEDELSMRAWAAGLPTITINLVRVRHDFTSVGRSPRGIAYRSFRNWLLIWWLHAPASVVPIKIFRLLGAALAYSLRHLDSAALRGIVDGVRLLPSVRRYREPLTVVQYRRLKRMPHALDFLHERRPGQNQDGPKKMS